MATDEEIIFEDHLYKLTGNKGKSLWSKSNPWKQRYFIVKKQGNKPVLEYYSKKPKNKNTSPKDKVVLWPSYRVEKVTNTRNRAYVFELTTQDKYLCLSADEQRRMDLFVFILQSQIHLREEIRDDMVIVQPENSESQRRIGAKGANCILHVCPWGVTLALQNTRSVLAQWPLKSVRYFEASGNGKFMLEAGRIAPMGDGMYVFSTQKGKDNTLYDILDQHIVNALGRTQPGRRGTTEEMEDYLQEFEKLSALTKICPSNTKQPEISKILQENWSIQDPNNKEAKPKPIIHSRQNSQTAIASVQEPPPPLPYRRPSGKPNELSSTRKPAQATNHNFHSDLSVNPLLDRPPLPPPTNTQPSMRSSQQSTSSSSHTKPLTIPTTDTRASQAYFRMNSTASGGVPSSVSSQFSPTENWTPPPSFQEATAYSPMDGSLPVRDGYLTPRNSAELANKRNSSERQSGYPEQYILPTAQESVPYDFHSLPRSKHQKNSNDTQRTSRYRIRSASCEELNDSYQLESPRHDRNINDQPYDLAKPQAPFKDLQNFRGSMEMICDTDDNRRASMDYYNISGLKGSVDANPNPSVGEVRKRFNDQACEEVLTRSISNPNFMHINSKDRLSDARVYSGKYGTLGSQSTLYNKRKSKSLLNLFKKSRDSKGKYSDRSSLGSSSNPSSPSGTLTRQTSIPMISIGGKEVYFTERSRSFRKPKPKDTESKENTPPGSRHNTYSKSPAASHRDLPPSGSRQSSTSKSPASSRTSSSSKSPAFTRRDVDATSPPLPKRERSSSYVNVIHSRSGSSDSSSMGHTSNGFIHSRSGSDIGSRTHNNVIHSRSGSDIQSRNTSNSGVIHSRTGSDMGSRNSAEMRRFSSSGSNKSETIC